jgi:MYXO-CTERM domain-containing protein
MSRRLLIAAAILAAPAIASAQWSDNFDSYATGSQLHGQGGWHGWDNDPAAGALTSNAQALSAPNSVAITGASDLVHEYTGTSSGQWSYEARQYIPSGFTGTTYFILLNTYANGGPYNWSIETQFNGATGVILDDFRTENPVSIVRDQWVPLRVDFDLTANTVSTFYNNVLLSTGTWTTGTGSALNLAAVDLFANNTGPVYYDNIVLRQVPAPAGLAVLGLGGLVAARRRRA